MSPDRPEVSRPEFSRPVAVGDIRARGGDYEIAADAQECAALARRFAIVAVESLSARLRLQPIGGGPLVRLSGTLAADVVQSCVVTLEPVAAHVEERVDMTFGPPGEAADEADGEGGIDLSPDGDDPPDPFVGGAVDMGEAVAEQLALALDPFPRAEGVEFSPPAQAADVPEKASPFAILARLRKKDA